MFSASPDKLPGNFSLRACLWQPIFQNERLLRINVTLVIHELLPHQLYLRAGSSRSFVDSNLPHRFFPSTTPTRPLWMRAANKNAATDPLHSRYWKVEHR